MDGKPVETEKVDIGRAASSLQVHSSGTLRRLDQAHRIKHRWFRATLILYLSAGTIFAILLVSLLVIGFSSDESSLSWARQTLTALMGFSAGAIWTASQKQDLGEPVLSDDS